jgi:hypothetical protein
MPSQPAHAAALAAEEDSDAHAPVIQELARSFVEEL